MPFTKISEVEGWEDFGFKFKEGNNETEWDDAHGIITFRYTEPMTWWMPMAKDLARTFEAAFAEAKRFGPHYLTVFNPAAERRTIPVSFPEPAPKTCRELLTDGSLDVQDGTVVLSFASEDVAVIEPRS